MQYIKYSFIDKREKPLMFIQKTRIVHTYNKNFLIYFVRDVVDFKATFYLFKMARESLLYYFLNQ